MNFLRARNDTTSSSPKKARTLSRMFSPSRSKPDNSLSPSSTSPNRPYSDALPPNPRTSTTSLAKRPKSQHDKMVSEPDVPQLPDKSIIEAHKTGDSTIGSDNVHSDTTEAHERDMNRHLMDMESSFLPDHSSSTHQRARPTSSSQTSSRSEASRDYRSSYNNAEHPSLSRGQTQSTLHRPNSGQGEQTLLSPNAFAALQATARSSSRGSPQPFARISEEDEIDYSDSPLLQSHPRHSLSSPSAAAAQRSKLRAATQGLNRPRSARDAAPNPTSSDRTNDQNSSRSRFSSSPQPSITVQSEKPLSSDTARQEDQNDHQFISPQPLPDKQTLAEEEGGGGVQTQRRLSTSSRLSHHAGSDGGTEHEYMEDGGATPGSLSTARHDQELSRIPSLGSVASSISIQTDRSTARRQRRPGSGINAPSHEVSLDRLDEERSQTQSGPTTPRANAHADAPTDTVLANNVRNLKVPATIARNFSEANQAQSLAQKSSIASSFIGGSKNNLTLKEQNSKIDKLSKENFDLKLKIHYLYQALRDRSEEGVKDLVTKNAQLQADLVKCKKDYQSLRKRLRELEREYKGREDGLSTDHTIPGESEDGSSSRDFRQAQMEEEIVYLRDRMQELEEENSRLGNEPDGRDSHMVNGLNRASLAVEAPANGDDRDAFWRAALDEESTRREQAESQLRELRFEAERLRKDRNTTHSLKPISSSGNMRSASVQSNVSQEAAESSAFSGSTAVEHLRVENANLRRDLGAQTSMLTSRNRERERLQQEIEDLKLVQRRGDGLQSVSGDALSERSGSMSMLAPSRQATSRQSQLGNSDRDHYETRQAGLREENAALRMRNQDLQRDLDMLTDSAEHLETLRSERDEAMQLLSEERDFATDTIDKLEELMEQKEAEAHQLLSDLRGREDETNALHGEVKSISESLNRVADDWENSQSTIQILERDLTNASGELEVTESNLKDAVAAKERLEVQAESSQNEISFLREEQEGDKIRISDLQAALHRAKANLQDEKQRYEELEEIESDLRQAKEEGRQLRKNLNAKDEEAAFFKDDLEQFEEGLRKALGSWQTGRAGLLNKASQLRQDISNVEHDLNKHREDLRDKDKSLQERDRILHTHRQEKQRLTDLLERERQAFNQHQKEREALTADGDEDDEDSRYLGLENAWHEDRQQFAALEERYILHLRDRNKLLFDLWSRLSTLCGPDWITQYCASQSCEPPTVDAASADLPAFDKLLQSALDSVESTMTTFRNRIRTTEQDIYKDFEALEYELNLRNKSVDRLEKHVSRQGPPINLNASTTSLPTADAVRLKDENRLLRRELKILKQGAFALPGLPSPQEDLERAATAAAAVERKREKTSRPNTTRSMTTPTLAGKSEGHFPSGLQQRANEFFRKYGNASEQAEGDDIVQPPLSPSRAQTSPRRGVEASDDQNMDRHLTLNGHGKASSTVLSTHSAETGNEEVEQGLHPNLAPSEQRWVLRLKELERRLYAERKARLLDRNGARKRLEEGRAEKEDLRRELERERGRGRLVGGEQVGGREEDGEGEV